MTDKFGILLVVAVVTLGISAVSAQETSGTTEAVSATASETATAATSETVELAGDTKKGRKVFRRCRACPMVKKEKNRIGPFLKGVIGRPAAAIESYKYSPAMAGSGITWTVPELTAYLKNPKGKVPGTKMNFPGLKKDDDIANVLAYIAEQSAAE